MIKKNFFAPLIKNVLLGKSINDYCVILFTRLDDLERDGLSLESFINENEKLKTFVDNFGNRYVGFNNTLGMETENMKHSISTLIDKIKETKSNNKQSCYTTQLFESSQMAFKLQLEEIKRERMSLKELNEQIEISNKHHKEELDKFQNNVESMVSQMKIDSIKKEKEIAELRKIIDIEKKKSDEYAKNFYLESSRDIYSNLVRLAVDGFTAYMGTNTNSEED